jgi:hypothetical protein
MSKADERENPEPRFRQSWNNGLPDGVGVRAATSWKCLARR